jgi:hypothetical protein
MYCKGNPVKYSDPSGYFQMDPSDQGVNQNFTNFVMNMESTVSQAKKDVIMRLTGMSENQLSVVLNGGTGPRIKIVNEGGGPAIYDPGRDERTIFVNIDDVKNFPAVSGATNGKAYTESYLLHESVTYGEYHYHRALYNANLKEAADKHAAVGDTDAHEFNKQVYKKFWPRPENF